MTDWLTAPPVFMPRETCARDVNVGGSDPAGMRATRIVTLETTGGQEAGETREDVALKLFVNDVEPALTPPR
jgi:hypothetical protein